MASEAARAKTGNNRELNVQSARIESRLLLQACCAGARLSLVLVALMGGTVAIAAEAERVLIFETNGVRLYVPEPWIWPNKAVGRSPAGDFIKPVPAMLPTDPAGTVYRVERGITLSPRAYEDRVRFPQLQPDLWVYRLEFRPGARGLASRPRKTLDDIPAPIRARLGPVDEDGFRQADPPKGPVFYGAFPEDVDPGGWPISFNCDSPLPRTGTYSWCFAERTAIEGLRIKYVWGGAKVPKSQWRRMDRRVQALVEWLAKPPEQRAATIEN